MPITLQPISDNEVVYMHSGLALDEKGVIMTISGKLALNIHLQPLICCSSCLMKDRFCLATVKPEPVVAAKHAVKHVPEKTSAHSVCETVSKTALLPLQHSSCMQYSEKDVQ